MRFIDSIKSRYWKRLHDLAGQMRQSDYRPEFDNGTVARLLNGRLPGVENYADLDTYLRTRTAPQLFFEPSSAKALTEKFSQDCPEEFGALVELIDGEVCHAYPVYTKSLPPLNQGISWKDLKPGPLVDNLYQLRPHQFSFAPRLAMVSHVQPEYLHTLQILLSDWQEYIGAGRPRHAYDNNLTVCHRLFACMFSWLLMGDDESAEPSTRHSLAVQLLQIICADIEFLLPRLGQSVANNHLLLDRFTGWFISYCFPEVSGADKESLAEKIWVDELLRQTYPDGGGFEHSTHYHEMLCLCGVMYLSLCRWNDKKTNVSVENRIKKMLRFQDSLGGWDNKAIPLGDGTDDLLLPLSASDNSCHGSLAALSSWLFDDQSIVVSENAAGREIAFWLSRGQAATSNINRQPASKTQQRLEITHFEENGLAIITANNVKLFFRTGVAPSAQVFPGHLHSDFLNLFLAIGGKGVFTPPGTATYRSGRFQGVGSVRELQLGAVGHNGLWAANEDPLGLASGEFRNSVTDTTASTQIISHSDRFVHIEATLQSSGPHNNRRRGILVSSHGDIFVYDFLPEALDPNKTRISWQLAGDCFAQQLDANITAVEVEDDEFIILASQSLGSPKFIRGRKTIAKGWIAPRYGQIIPATCLEYQPANSARGFAVFIGGGGTARFANATLALESKGLIEFSAQVTLGNEMHNINIGRDQSNQATSDWQVRSLV